VLSHFFLGLPHSYTIHETDNVDAVAEELKHQPTTIWGCSITIPLKEKAVQIVDKLTPEASEIGAINTIIREESGHLIGDNTDWLGIVRCLKRAAKKCKLKILNNKNTALVVGAGGTAKAAVYALKKLKFTTIYVYNRTKVSAHSLARRFNVFACDSLSEVELMTFDVVISTLPNHAEVNLPEKIILCKPVFFQVSYKATNLEFLRKLFEGGCKLIGGEELLIYQGLEQSKRWTGTQVLPERTIRAKLHERCGSLYITNFF
jgi:shikimate dehydrogenase